MSGRVNMNMYVLVLEQMGLIDDFVEFRARCFGMQLPPLSVDQYRMLYEYTLLSTKIFPDVSISQAYINKLVDDNKPFYEEMEQRKIQLEKEGRLGVNAGKCGSCGGGEVK